MTSMMADAGGAVHVNATPAAVKIADDSLTARSDYAQMTNDDHR